MELQRREDESLAAYVWRVGQAKANGLIDESWDMIAEIANPQFFDDEANYLGESAYRKRYSIAKEFYDGVFRDLNEHKMNNKMLWDLKEERIKLQTEKLEYNKWLRENARDELIFEKIKDCVEHLKPLDVPNGLDPIERECEFVLALGDTHYGAEFDLLGLYGEIINSYSPEIFEERMWRLRDEVLNTMFTNEADHLNIVFLGDAIDGELRVSQLMKLRYGVVDSAIYFAEFMSKWLNELSKHVTITFNYTVGNHGELRMLGQPKGTFTEDNMEKVILSYLNVRLADNPNIMIVENPTGYIFQEYCGSNVLCIHGEVKNMEKAITDFSRIYRTKIDYLIAGHKHHGATKDVGMSSEVINVPSIIGTDPYALSLNMHTNAGAKMFVFEEGKGLTTTFSYKLD